MGNSNVDGVRSRPEWDTYFFRMATLVATRSTCPSRAVGCVIIDMATKHVISTGYNGAPRGTAHCGAGCMSRESGKSWEKCRAVHAELNAILNAAKNGVSTDGCRMYLTTTPCVFCSRTLINAGVKEVYAMAKYTHDEAIALLSEGGINVKVISPVELTDLVRFS